MKSLYEDTQVEKRFNEFGGILRYCLPQCPEVLLDARENRNAALQEAGRTNLIRFQTNKYPEVSDNFAHFKVELSEPEPFTKATIDLLNNHVENELQREWLSVSLLDKIRTLMRKDETVYMDKACQGIFDDIVAENLMRKVSWHQRFVAGEIRDEEDKESFSTWSELRRVDGVVPKFRKMKEGVLYVPLKVNFPLGDMV